MFSLLPIFLMTLLIILAALALFTAALLTCVLFSAWLLTLISPLSFAQASVLTAITALLFIRYEREEFDLQPTNLVLLIFIATPLIDLLILALAWLVDFATSLDFLEATLLAASIGLATLYNLLVRIASFSEHILETANENQDEVQDQDEDQDKDLMEWLYSNSSKKK